MTQDSELAAKIDAAQRRFDRAVAEKFSFLTTNGFTRCEIMAIDMSDIRDACFVSRYTKYHSAIHVSLLLLTYQVSVVKLHCREAATCDYSQPFDKSTSLDKWTQNHGPLQPPPLSWMKTQTISEEVRRSYRAYTKRAVKELEAIVAFQAERLRASGILDGAE